MASLTPRLDKIQAGNNLAINGGMDFWQRNTTFTINNTAAYTADRMQVFHSQGGGNTVTIDRSTDVPTFAQSGFNSRYSLKFTNNHNVAITGNTAISYNIEGNDYAMLHAGYGRVQFWCKTSVAGDYCISFRNNANDRSYVSKFTLTANTWTLVQKDIAFDTTGTWLFDENLGIRMFIGISAPAASQTSTFDQWQSGNFNGHNTPSTWNQTVGATFFVTQLAIVQGDFSNNTDSVVPFRRAGKNITEELRMCQRYYEKSYDLDVFSGAISNNGAYGSSIAAFASGRAVICCIYKVTKRAIATVAVFNPSTGASSGIRVGTLDEGGGTTFNGHSSVVFSAGGNYSGQTANGCQAHFTASAEL